MTLSVQIEVARIRRGPSLGSANTLRSAKEETPAQKPAPLSNGFSEGAGQGFCVNLLRLCSDSSRNDRGEWSRHVKVHVKRLFWSRTAIVEWSEVLQNWTRQTVLQADRPIGKSARGAELSEPGKMCGRQ